MTASLNDEPKIDAATVRAGRNTLLADRAEDAQKVQGLKEQAREARARGDDENVITELLRLLRAAQDRLENTEEAIAELEGTLPILVRVETERGVKHRLTAIARAHGSARASLEDDIARAEATAAELLSALGRLTDRHETLRTLETEVLFLGDRFPSVPLPDLPRVTSPGADPRVSEILSRVRGARVEDARPLPRKLVDVRAVEARKLEARLSGTPTAEILAQAGYSLAEHDRRHQDAMNARRDEIDRARKAELDRIDQWVRAEVAEGPVAKEAMRAAAVKAGISLPALRDAAQRVGVVGVVRVGDGATDYWCIGKAPEGFEIPRQTIRSAAMSYGMR